MLFLLMMPVFVVVATAHRLLQNNAPSNVLIARARMAAPRWRTALLVSALATGMLVVMNLLASAVAAGAPGWLNLLVLIFGWDAIKFGMTAASVALRCSVRICRSVRRQCIKQCQVDRSLLAQAEERREQQAMADDALQYKHIDPRLTDQAHQYGPPTAWNNARPTPTNRTPRLPH